MIFHLALAGDWAEAVRAGEYRVSTLGRTLEEEGFIHASADLEQAFGVARRFYRDVAEPLVLLHIDVDRLGAPVRFEVPDGMSEAFPHIYGPIPVAAVVTVTPFAVEDIPDIAE
ncbi:DUF952 domain-containing protein [Microbispora corallina]|uniref:DUF952 domain-containing protein n=1 Tax=Microbispora corallina TaxID=83302 RepID=A0ABQ4G627_9ACTN|nr:DUF952 domain-containing protein [Microbispora corallina]GIH42486.1 hypothetical protein Mco01_54860 [Microbispora corallina]